MTHDHQTKHTHSSSPDPLARGGWVGAHWPGTLMEATGMEVLEHSATRTVISMPIDGNRQSAGILHGGASAALAETAASFAAQIHAREANPGKQAYAVGTAGYVPQQQPYAPGQMQAPGAMPPSPSGFVAQGDNQPGPDGTMPPGAVPLPPGYPSAPPPSSWG